MKPDDILSAIGEVDDAYIKKAHRKSLRNALLTFAVIVVIGIIIVSSLMEKNHILLRFNTDGSVNTGYADPEVLLYDSWTSLEQTTYVDGVPVSTTKFQYRLFGDYAVTHIENGETVQIIGSVGSISFPRDYLESKQDDNLYISTYYGMDLLDQIDLIAIQSGAAFGEIDKALNHIELTYFERGERILRQTRLENARTNEETVISIRGYSYQNDRISGWQEWDPEYNLLRYAEYSYDGNVQTVSTYLADGTLTGTRVSKYSFGNLKSREYYDAAGNLTGKEVYRYRVWELFLSLEGLASIVIILSLAATAGFAVWDDRFQLDNRLVVRSVVGKPQETRKLLQEVEELKTQISAFSEKLSPTTPEAHTEDIQQLTAELQKLNEHLSKLLDFDPDNN